MPLKEPKMPLPEFNKIRVYRNLQNWCREGRSMPGYSLGYGGPYIGYLLGLTSSPVDSSLNSKGYLDLEDEITKAHPRIWEMLEGPNGWTILQMLIARKHG